MRLCNQIARSPGTNLQRQLLGDHADWDVERLILTRLLYAVEVANWNYAAAHKEKNAPYPPEPEPVLPPWDRKPEEPVEAGVVDAQAQSGKKRIGGRTRMSIEQMKKRLGW